MEGLGSMIGALEYWHQRKSVYPMLAPIAEDFASAPASEAFVECIFSVAGLLSAGRRKKREFFSI